MKIGLAGQTAKYQLQAQNDNYTTDSLLTDYTRPNTTASTTNVGNSMRTPRNLAQGESIKNQARNLKVMAQLQTPLLGGDQPDLEESNNAPLDPKLMRTPNTVFGAIRGTSSTLVDHRSASVRDGLAINTPRESALNTPFTQFTDDPNVCF